MNKAKKTGIMFIVVGLFIPLVFYPFTELKEDAKKTQLLSVYGGKKYTPRLSDLKVDTWGYPSIIAIGLVSIFLGISIIVLTGKKKSEKETPNKAAAQSLGKSKEKLSMKNANNEIAEQIDLNASSSADFVDEITEELVLDASASDEFDNEITEKIELDASNSFGRFIVIVFTVHSLDELTRKIGRDYAEELLKVILGNIHLFFLSYDGVALRERKNEMSVVLYCDLEKGQSICKSFKNYFLKKIIPELNAKIKIKKSDEKLEVQILAGIAQGTPMIEIESIKEFARYNQTPILRIKTPKT